MRVRFPPGTAGGNRTRWVRLIRVARRSPTSQGGSPSTSHRFPLAPFPPGTAGNEPVVSARAIVRIRRDGHTGGVYNQNLLEQLDFRSGESVLLGDWKLPLRRHAPP